MNWGTITLNHNVNLDSLSKFVDLIESLAKSIATIFLGAIVVVAIVAALMDSLAKSVALVAVASVIVVLLTRHQPAEAAPAPDAAPEVVAQKLKEAEITEFDSLLLTRNLPRIAIFYISYIRELFPENYFHDKSALEMKIKWLMPKDAESRRIIDWTEKGVYDALQKKYLKTLLFCVCETVKDLMIEEYAFSFSYSNSESQEVSVNVNRIGNKRQGGTLKCNSSTEISPNLMRSSACEMVSKLIQIMSNLDKMPEERTILMKLLYYDDVTPEDYEPPFFRGCTEEEINNPWTKNPPDMEAGNVNSKHLVLALKVKSVLGTCKVEKVSLEAGPVEGDASDLKTETADSRESFTQVMENGRTNGNGDNCGEFDAAMCSKSSSQSKRSRKASTVKEPILQYTKRQKAQVA